MEPTSCFWPTFLEYAMAIGEVIGRMLVILSVVAAIAVPAVTIYEQSNRPWLWIPLYWLALCVVAVAITAYIHCA